MSGRKPTKVVFNDVDQKRIILPSPDIDDVKSEICRRFGVQSDMSMLAIVEERGGPEKYSISSTEDLEALWDDFSELRVTSKEGVKRHGTSKHGVKTWDYDKTVEIHRERYSIDVVPEPRTAVVQKALQELGVIGDMEEFGKSFGRMGTIANISYYAAVATGNQQLQLETKDLGFSAIRICHAAESTVQRYVLTCGTVNETFHTAIVYLLEDDYIRALVMISSLEGVAQECADKTNNLIGEIDKVCQSKILSDETRLMIMKEREKAEVFEKEQQKKQLELDHVQSQIKESAQPGATKSFLQMLGSNVFRTAKVVVGAITDSAPQFLIAAGKELLGYAADKERDEEQKKYEERMRHEEQRKKKQDAEKHKLQLSLDLQDLQRDIQEANTNNDKCFHILGGELLKMRADLEHVKSFFKELSLFCETVKASEKTLMRNIRRDVKAEGERVDCGELLASEGLREQLVYYQAKWVAIKDVCLNCRRKLGKTKQELHAHIERNPTKGEARRDIGGMIDDMRRAL